MKQSPPPQPASLRPTVLQSVVAPLILGVAALIALANLPLVNSKGQSLNPLRDLFLKGDRFHLDQYHEHSHKTPARSDVVILGVDDASQQLDTLWPEDIEASPALIAMKNNPWPWPRRVWAYLLDRVFAAGAKMVFLDFTFKSPSSDPEDDRLLREALERHKGKVIIGGKFEKETVGNVDQVKMMTPVETLGTPLPEGSYHLGVLAYWPDYDDVIRKARFTVTRTEAEAIFTHEKPVNNPHDVVLPSVSRLLAEAANPSAVENLPSEARLRFCDPSAFAGRSLHEIFVEDLWKANFGNGEHLKDKFVLVGATASDLHDFQQIIPERIFGIQLHAHAYSALMARSFVTEAPEWWRWAGIGGAVLAAWLIVSLLRQPLLSAFALIMITVGVLYGSYATFDQFSIEFSPLASLVTLNLCGIAGLTGNYVMQLRESRKLQRFLVRYTSPDFVDEMMRDRAGLYTMLGGVERTVTVFFSDVRGFTSMSENMTPTEVVNQLNEYLSRMVEPVFKNRGLVDKYIGDAVMALWGSTRSKPSQESFKQDAINAVTSSLAMRKALEELNVIRKERGQEPLAIGMGIHQGEVTVGNIGSEHPYEKMDLTVIGDPVNLASRLEGATKTYGVDLIISSVVHHHVKEAFLCRTADLVAVKGKVKPVEVFAVIDVMSGSQPPGLETFEIAMRLYREGRFTEAEAAFTQSAAEGLDDMLCSEYLERCRNLIANPPEHWDGVYKMTKK